MSAQHKKWEYAIRVETFSTTSERENWLNSYGERGWELISCRDIGYHIEMFELLFKKELENEE